MHTGCNIRCSFCVLGSALECANHDDNIGCYLHELSEHHGQARGWGNVKATLRWGVFLFLQLFKMLSEHQHLTRSMSRPHEGLHTELVLSAGTPGCGASVIVLRDEMR